jgi:bifunctional ADP-heptose synthase (sugar kinase/adenylyltransferase)
VSSAARIASRRDAQATFVHGLVARLPRCHGLVVSDYGKGVITRSRAEKPSAWRARAASRWRGSQGEPHRRL